MPDVYVSYAKRHIMMNDKNKSGKLPTDVIIASFKGDLTDSQRIVLNDWLSLEGSQEKYMALKRVWDQTVSDAGIFDSQKAYGKLRSRKSNIWRRLAIAASMAAVLAVGFTLYNIYTPEPTLIQTYACVTGKSSVILPDGSSVVLHKGATLSYDNSFSKDNRTVSLDGEAYFDVAKDKENTFTVKVDDVDITVYGTSFNVLEDNESVVVSLVEGSVAVTTKSGTSCALEPGHSAIFAKQTGNLTDRKDDVAFATCWAQDRLTFTQASLGEVCRYISKWYGVEIVIPDALKSSCSYTFTIREEPIDQILGIMSRINPIKYIYTNDQRIIISEIL